MVVFLINAIIIKAIREYKLIIYIKDKGEWIAMVYEYVTYPDETLVTFSDIRKKGNGEEYIRVCLKDLLNMDLTL